MGRTKQLLPLGDRPVIAHAAEAIAGSGIRNIVVVTGRDHKLVREALSHLPVKFAYNSDPDSDMTASIIIGMKEVAPEASAVLIALADHPLVSAKTIAHLLQMYEQDPDRIIIPVYKGRRGHPSLFPMDMLQGLGAGGSLRDIIAGNRPKTILAEVTDEGVVLDMDTEEDYRRILTHYSGPLNAFSPPGSP